MTTSNIDWTKATVRIGVPVAHTATSDIQEIEMPISNFFLLAKWAYEQDLKKIDDALRVRSPSERYEAYNIFVTGEMENGTYNTIPHCDSRILHGYSVKTGISASLWYDCDIWTLSTHPTGEVPERLTRLCTSRGETAPKDTRPLVIPLTEPAHHVLELKLLRGNQSEAPTPISAPAAAPIIHVDNARSVSAFGGRDISPNTHPNEEPSWQKSKWIEPMLAASIFGNSNLLNHAQIAVPVFLGTSWNLIIGTEEGWKTLPLPLSPVVEDLRDSNLKSLNVIWSALTAIKSELTLGQWQVEHARRFSAECSYCDRPEWHRKRVELGIACTGHAPKDNEIPCEADLLRPPGGEGDHRRWGGNKPTSAKGDPSWPQESYASLMMYGHHWLDDVDSLA